MLPTKRELKLRKPKQPSLLARAAIALIGNGGFCTAEQLLSKVKELNPDYIKVIKAKALNAKTEDGMRRVWRQLQVSGVLNRLCKIRRELSRAGYCVGMANDRTDQFFAEWPGPFSDEKRQLTRQQAARRCRPGAGHSATRLVCAKGKCAGTSILHEILDWRKASGECTRADLIREARIAWENGVITQQFYMEMLNAANRKLPVKRPQLQLVKMAPKLLTTGLGK